MQTDQLKSTLSPAAVAALNQGNKIEAIKLLRQERGLELKDAKDTVEQYLAMNPSVQANYSAIQAQTGRKGLWWLVVVIAGAILAYVFLTKH